MTRNFTARDRSSTTNIWSLILFILAVFGGGLLIGLLTAPGAWYVALVKPNFNPPNWIFAPVWSILYILIAFAGWRIWSRDRNGRAMRIWRMQLALNFLWSPIFFEMHAMGLALLVILLLLGTIMTFIVIAWPQDRVASSVFVPYAAWVGFASLLNASLLLLNRT